MSLDPIEIAIPPEKSDWVCYIWGDPSQPGSAFTLSPNKGFEPNRFHRKMQELVFGVKWRKINLDKPKPNC